MGVGVGVGVGTGVEFAPLEENVKLLGGVPANPGLPMIPNVTVPPGGTLLFHEKVAALNVVTLPDTETTWAFQISVTTASVRNASVQSAKV